jgi:hypothetical protein
VSLSACSKYECEHRAALSKCSIALLHRPITSRQLQPTAAAPHIVCFFLSSWAACMRCLLYVRWQGVSQSAYQPNLPLPLPPSHGLAAPGRLGPAVLLRQTSCHAIVGRNPAVCLVTSPQGSTRAYHPRRHAAQCALAPACGSATAPERYSTRPVALCVLSKGACRGVVVSRTFSCCCVVCCSGAVCKSGVGR